MEGNNASEEIMSFAKNKKLTVQRYQKDDIIRVFEKIGFSLINFTSQDYYEPDESITIDMIFCFEKN